MSDTPKAKVVQITTTHSGSLFALLDDGSIYERERTGANPIGEGQYKWKRLSSPFPGTIDTALSDEIAAVMKKHGVTA